MSKNTDASRQQDKLQADQDGVAETSKPKKDRPRKPKPPATATDPAAHAFNGVEDQGTPAASDPAAGDDSVNLSQVDAKTADQNTGLANKDRPTLDFEAALFTDGANPKRKALPTLSSNRLLSGLGALAGNSAMVAAQQSIYGSQIGFRPLYQMLDGVINEAMLWDEATDKEVHETVVAIHKDLEDGYGYANIGCPKLPAIKDNFATQVKENTCKALIDILFPLADSSIRSKYTKVTKWSKEHNRHSFVDWLENDIRYESTSGYVNCGKGLKGALKFISIIEKSDTPTVKSDQDPIDLAKQIGSNTRFEVPIPGWLDAEISNCLILAFRENNKFFLYDVMETEKKTIGAGIVAAAGVLTPERPAPDTREAA